MRNSGGWGWELSAGGVGADAPRLFHPGGSCRGRGKRRGAGRGARAGRRSVAPGRPWRGPGPPVMAVSLWVAAEEAESRRARVLWCAVGPQEESKCQQWSAQSNGKVTCVRASTTEDCIALVMVGRRPPWEPASRGGGTARPLENPRWWASA